MTRNPPFESGDFFGSVCGYTLIFRNPKSELGDAGDCYSSWWCSAGLITGILIGTYLGGTLAQVLSEGTLRIMFAAVLVWTGARYLRAKRPDL